VTSALSARAVSFAFEGRPVLQNLKLEIASGDFVCLLGPSGCGKSTMLRLLAGLLSPETGSIERSEARLSFVFQDARLLPWKTVEENIMLPFALQKVPPPSSEKILRQVGMWESRDLFPHQLSGGMKQRTAIARALITDPQVLLMDEPFSALDESTRFELEALLRDLWVEKKMTLVFVTHSTTEAVFLGERILVMAKRHGAFFADRKVLLPKRTEALRTSPEFNQNVREISQLVHESRREVPR
jgi:NitT/TauT family transport system ATP-binding protein